MNIHPLMQNKFAFLLFFIISIFLYSSTFDSTWLMDDYSVIVNNSDIRSVSNFITNTFPGRPLREISFLLDYKVFGLNPWGYHFQNIFWHSVCTWLVYLLALRINLNTVVARLSALLFLVHPIHVEVVANSSHRKDSLALAFILCALLAYIQVINKTNTVVKYRWFVFTILLWYAAYLAKGNALVFPFIVLAYEYSVVDESDRFLMRCRHFVPIALGVLGVSILSWYIYISQLTSLKSMIVGAFIKTENLSDFSVLAYALMVLKSFSYMFSKLIAPVNLSMEYIYEVPLSIYDLWVVSSIVLCILFVIYVYRWRQVSRKCLFLILFGAIMWIPTSNIFWYLSYFAADRYMYAPSAGFCILAVAISEQWLVKSKQLHLMIWGCLIVICAGLTWRQTYVWKNEVSLYSHMLAVSPRSLEAMIGLMNAKYSAKDYSSASNYAKLAIERDPSDYRPYMTLANMSIKESKLREAIELLKEAQMRNNKIPEIHNLLGSLYDEIGDSNNSIRSLSTALELRPDYVEASTNLGVVYERNMRFTDAEKALQKALAVNKDYIPAWYNLGIVKYRIKDFPGARYSFEEVLKREPDNRDALTNLAEVCRELRDAGCYTETTLRMNSNPQPKSNTLPH